LPKGWIKKASTRPLWSDVVDAKEQKRLAVYYQSLFGRGSAFTLIKYALGYEINYLYSDGTPKYSRDSLLIDPDRKDDFGTEKNSFIVVNYITNEIIFESNKVLTSDKEAVKIEEKSVITYLNTRFPGWNKDPLLYWN